MGTMNRSVVAQGLDERLHRCNSKEYFGVIEFYPHYGGFI